MYVLVNLAIGLAFAVCFKIVFDFVEKKFFPNYFK